MGLMLLNRLLTPELIPEPNERTARRALGASDDSNATEDLLNAEGVADLAREATILLDNPIADTRRQGTMDKDD